MFHVQKYTDVALDDGAFQAMVKDNKIVCGQLPVSPILSVSHDSCLLPPLDPAKRLPGSSFWSVLKFVAQSYCLFIDMDVLLTLYVCFMNRVQQQHACVINAPSPSAVSL